MQVLLCYVMTLFSSASKNTHWSEWVAYYLTSISD